MIDRHRLGLLLEHELESFRDGHSESFALYADAQKSLFGGVPMSWMMKWAGRFPVFMRRANGARLIDADDTSYIDFCLVFEEAVAQLLG